MHDHRRADCVRAPAEPAAADAVAIPERVPGGVGSLTPAAVVALQRTIGNHAVADLLSGASHLQIQRARWRPQRSAAANQWGRRSQRGRPLWPTFSIPLGVLQLGNQLRQSYTAHEGADAPGAGGRNFVYVATVRGRVSYVGISNNPDDRQAQHGARFHLHVLNRPRPFSRIEVRGIEQFGINISRGTGQNIAESISQRHPYYDDAVAFGRAFLRWAIGVFGSRIAFGR